MLRSLVTGGAGFIGSHVGAELLKLGHEVVILDDLSGGFVENVPGGAIFEQGSILDVALIERLFSRYRFCHVYHLAAYAAEGLSHFIRRYNYSTNLIGTVNLVNASVKYAVTTFVFTSSIAVYGAAQTPMNEGTIPIPEDPYGIAKLASELDIQAAARLFDLQYVIFRPHNVYGENQNIGDRYRNVVGIFMNQTLKGEPMTIFGDGDQVRAFTYIGDVAPIIASCVDNPAARNGTFNIGADVPCSVNHLAQVVAAAMARPLHVEHLPPRNEVKVAFSDHTRAISVFGPKPMTTLEQGVGRMAEWVQRHGSRQSKPFQQIEVSARMPPSWHTATAL